MADEDPNQWRIDNARHAGLQGVALHFRPYRRRSENWDHDHCAACRDTFAEVALLSDALHEGYTTGKDFPRGEEYEWVCPTCFTELAGILGWTAARE
jgi:hypothetical protein